MDKSAIEAIQTSALTRALSEKLAHADKTVVALPDNFRIHDLEKFMSGPMLLHGKFNTATLSAFTLYCADAIKQQGDNKPSPKCFIDADRMSAKAIFDIGDYNEPGHCEHTATLQLDATAPYKALKQINGEAKKQKAIAEWIEDWAPYIQAIGPNGEALATPKVIAAVRNISIETMRKASQQVSQLSENRSAMESIEAKSQEQIPAQIHFTCKPYECLTERTFCMRLSILTRDEPMVCLHLIQQELVQEEIATEFSQLVAKETEDLPIPVFIGTFSK